VYYADFRAFADVGGRCEALRAPHQRFATASYDEARAAYEARRAHYEGCRVGRAAAPDAATAGPVRLGPMLAEHLGDKARTEMRPGTLRRMEGAANVLLDRLGNVRLTDITARLLQTYVQRRRDDPGLRAGTKTSTASIRIELSLLSNAFARAVAFRYVTENPVPLLPDKPAAPAPRNVWLTREESGRLLDAAAEHDALARCDHRTCTAWGLDPHDRVWQDTANTPAKHGRAVQWEQRRDDAEAILATLLYTGGRISEVLGLTVADVNVAAGTVEFRHNRFRQLKRKWHERDVELWPPLAAVLREHVARLGLGPTDPLFPTEPGSASPVTRIDKLLARCCRRARLTGKAVSPHTLRHTFTTALLRTFTLAADGRTVQRSAFDDARRRSATARATCGPRLRPPVRARSATHRLTMKRTAGIRPRADAERGRSPSRTDPTGTAGEARPERSGPAD
jgi:integrase